MVLLGVPPRPPPKGRRRFGNPHKEPYLRNDEAVSRQIRREGRPLRPSIRLGRIAGVDIGVHYSWFVILVLVSWSLAVGYLPQRSPDWATGTYWATGVLAALLLFASVLIHELAHSLVAKARGLRVQGITLFLLGGMSNMQDDARRPRDELIIAAVGPMTSFALSGLFWLALLGIRNANTPVGAVVWYLTFINLLLGAFNLLPAFPLDGGRVLRSLVWGATGSLSKATRVAAFGGRTFGILLMAAGAFQVFTGNLLGGLWFAFIGWFLHGNAAASQQETALEARMEGVTVKDVIDARPITIGPDLTLSDVLFEYFLNRGVKSLVVCDGDKLMGILTLADARGVPRERWDSVRVREVMTVAPLWQVSPDDDLLHAMGLLGEHSIDQAPVVHEGRVVGLLSRAHVIRYLHSHRERGVR